MHNRFAAERLAARTAIIAWCLLAALAVSGLVVPGYGEKASPYTLPASAHPTRLVVPSLHINAPLVPIEITPEGALDPPRDYHKVGWWRGSATPGASRGQTVVTGHTVHTGGGVMDDLGEIERGARIRIVTAKGTMFYRAQRKKTYSREALARHAYYLFNQKRTPVRLVLITCTGWTGTDYTSNEVVFARPVGAIPPRKKHHHKKGKHGKHGKHGSRAGDRS